MDNQMQTDVNETLFRVAFAIIVIAFIGSLLALARAELLSWWVGGFEAVFPSIDSLIRVAVFLLALPFVFLYINTMFGKHVFLAYLIAACLITVILMPALSDSFVFYSFYFFGSIFGLLFLQTPSWRSLLLYGTFWTLPVNLPMLNVFYEGLESGWFVAWLIHVVFGNTGLVLVLTLLVMLILVSPRAVSRSRTT